MLDGYRVLGELGRGGTATVFEVVEPDTGERRALKLAREGADAFARARLFREYQILGELTHPAFPKALGVGHHTAEQPYVLLERVPGMRVQRWVGADRQRALHVVGVVADALATLHTHGLVHGDVSCGNIVAHDDGVHVIDLGGARRMGERWFEGIFFGTTGYCAPEQLRGRTIGPAADVYALGVVLYRLLAGRSPFRAADRRTLARMHRHDAPPPLADEHADLVMAMLAKHAHERPTADVVARALGHRALESAAPAPLALSIAAPSVAEREAQRVHLMTLRLLAEGRMSEARLRAMTLARELPSRARGLALLGAAEVEHTLGRHARADELLVLARQAQGTTASGYAVAQRARVEAMVAERETDVDVNALGDDAARVLAWRARVAGSAGRHRAAAKLLTHARALPTTVAGAAEVASVARATAAAWGEAPELSAAAAAWLADEPLHGARFRWARVCEDRAAAAHHLARIMPRLDASDRLALALDPWNVRATGATGAAIDRLAQEAR